MILSDEESKAIQEVAKTAAEYKDPVTSLGEFIGGIVGHPLTHAGGLVGDALGMVRIEMAMRFKRRVDRIMEERGMNGLGRTIPLSTAYPLLEAATLEEDEELSEMFAQLLVNAMDESEEIYVPKSFVETIRTMSPFEAKILKAMVDAPPGSKTASGMMYTRLLPDAYLSAPLTTDQKTEPVPQNVSLALASLEKAGCIDGMLMVDGGSHLREACITEYGRALIKACSPSKASLAPIASR